VYQFFKWHNGHSGGILNALYYRSQPTKPMTEFTHDQSPVKMEFTYEEHDFLNSILNHTQECYDFAVDYDYRDLPEDSEILKRYKMLESLRNRSRELWCGRFSK
jgi:hypothetical protein